MAWNTVGQPSTGDIGKCSDHLTKKQLHHGCDISRVQTHQPSNQTPLLMRKTMLAQQHNTSTPQSQFLFLIA